MLDVAIAKLDEKAKKADPDISGAMPRVSGSSKTGYDGWVSRLLEQGGA